MGGGVRVENWVISGGWSIIAFMLLKRLLLLLAIGCIGVSACVEKTPWKQVSSFRFDWNGRRNVQVNLESTADADVGDFTQIRILVPGEKPFVARNNSGWVKYGSETAATYPDFRKYRNRAPSEYVLAADATKAGRTLLFLVGYSYASSPGSLDVIELPGSGPPRSVMHVEELGLEDLRDLDGDGVAEVVGYPCLSQEYGNGLETYDPLQVFKLGADVGSDAKISIPLSRQYNLKHYYGWAGINCREDIAVVLHPPGGKKPKILSEAAARQLTEGPAKAGVGGVLKKP